MSRVSSAPPRTAVIAGVAYLNARPLLWGLEQGLPGSRPYRFETATPAVIAEQLAAGGVDAALLPTVAAAGTELVCLPEIGIAADAEVRSVALFSRRPIEELERIVVTAESRSSVALLRLLYLLEHGREPVFERAQEAEKLLADGAEACLLIGDQAWKLWGHSGLHEIDLAAWWFRLTALPFVFALWALNPVLATDLTPLLRRSAEIGAAAIDEIVSAAGGGDDERHYLRELIHHRLDERCHRGMSEFLRLACEHDIIPAGELHFHDQDHHD